MIDERRIASIIGRARSRHREVLDDDESLRVLEALSIATVRRQFVDARSDEPYEALLRAYHELGPGLVLKGLAAGVTHKTDRDLVVRDIRDEGALERGFALIRERAGDALEGCLLCALEDSSREVACGLLRDPDFGPTVMVGFGGIHAELVDDVQLRVAPLDMDEALDAISGLRTRAVLDAYRGRCAVDRESLARVLVQLGRLGVEFPEVAEMDVNPILFNGGEPVAVDATVFLGRP